MTNLGGVSAPPAEAMAALGDTSSLKTRLRRAERRRKVAAFGLVAPLFLFILLTFALPIGGMLLRSVEDPEVSSVLPHTEDSLKTWDGKAVPNQDTFRALAIDLTAAKQAGTITAAARRLNYDINGFRSLLMAAARKIPAADAPDPHAAFVEIDKRWDDRATWAAISRARGPVTDFYLLAAVDMQRDVNGQITRSAPERAIYLDVLQRTFRISLTVTVLCLLLAFPVAYLMSTQPAKVANILMILVLLPFWTSLLVRTTAWVVLLQNEGLVNHLLIWLGIIEKPMRLIYNSIGVHVAMTHVLLPFMILPLYSTMKAISPVYMRAAASLGAPPPVAFLRVYLPQCLPGIAAGCLLVFILAIGYYITPALVGGAGDQMLSYFIAFYTTDSVNWGMASALGAVLLATTMILYGVYHRLIGGGGIKMG
jgi:putative spermidine/putrescine transport system permease protein